MTEQYSLGDAVLCAQGQLLYEAKIQDIKKDKGVTLYGVHYKGWNKSWDEYVTDARLFKVNEENLRKQKELFDAVKKKKKPSVPKKAVKKTGSESENSSREGSKDKDFTQTKNVAVRLEKLKKDSESGDYVNNKDKAEEEKPVISSRTRTIKPVVAFKATEVPKSMKKKSKKDLEKESVTASSKPKSDKSLQNSRPQSPSPAKRRREFGQEIVIPLPQSLKTVLVDDFDYIDRQRKLVNIPARYSVDDLIRDYVSYNKENTGSREVEEVCRGLRDYFNCTLGNQLLYKFERVQYADILKASPGELLSSLYGPVHLLRLVTKLGPMLTSIDIGDQDLEKLLGDISNIVTFMEERKKDIFLLEDYGTATPEYHRRAL